MDVRISPPSIVVQAQRDVPGERASAARGAHQKLVLLIRDLIIETGGMFGIRGDGDGWCLVSLSPG
jgi:hypothetical protein